MKQMKLTQLKAIRLKCLDCCSGSEKEVLECVCEHCSLYPYRFGHAPVNIQDRIGSWACGDGCL